MSRWNKEVFEHQLPSDLPITWNTNLRTTAGEAQHPQDASLTLPHSDFSLLLVPYSSKQQLGCMARNAPTHCLLCGVCISCSSIMRRLLWAKDEHKVCRYIIACLDRMSSH